MKISAKGIQFIHEVEGSSKVMYRDSKGLPTIGVGHLLTEDELKTERVSIGGKLIGWKYGLSEAQVNQLLAQDVARFEKDVNQTIKVPLKQHEFDALVSFALNIGTGAFSPDTGVVKVLNAGDYLGVPAQIAKWNKKTIKGVKVVSKGATNRRKKEIQLWRGQR